MLHPPPRRSTSRDGEQKALRPPCRHVRRALLLNERAQFIFLITGAKDEALVLAEQATSILRQHPPTPDTVPTEIYAESLVSRFLWDTNHPQAVQAASPAL